MNQRNPRGNGSSSVCKKAKASFRPRHLIEKVERLVAKEAKSWFWNMVVSMLRFSAQSRFALPLIAGYVSTNLRRIGSDANTLCPVRLLVLNEERYRADLEVLGAHPDVELYSLPSRIQNLVNAIWLSEARWISTADPDAYLHNLHPVIQRVRRRLHLFLTKLIGLIAKKHGLNGITSCTFYYRQDREWESAGQEIGIPFFALHKENMKDPVIHKATIERYRKRSFRFFGSRLFLGNELEQQVIIKAGCADPEKVSVVGALRMDTLYERVRNNNSKSVRKSVVLFSTHHRLGLVEIDGVRGLFNPRRDAGFIRHFVELHGNFVKVAILNPDTEFVIKTKWLGNWYEEIVAAVKEVVGVDPKDVANLVITDSIPAQDLIESAMVVIGLNSTTLLEAKLSHVPVILPLFAEAADKYFKSNVYFHKYMHVFTIANSPEELCDELLRALDGQLPHQVEIPDSMIRDYLGFFDGRVAERVVSIMKQDIASALKGRARVGCEGEKCAVSV